MPPSAAACKNALVPATYTLPPAVAAKAIALARLMVDLHFAHELWPIAALLILLALRIPARLGNAFARLTPRPWLQTLLFAAAFLALMQLLSLPISLTGHRALLRYGLSIQPWHSWFADYATTFALNLAVSVLLACIAGSLIRRSPRRWWLWMWTIFVPLLIVGVVVTPLVIDPLFNRFEPLSQTDPALVQQLELVVHRGGISIPPSRIYLMRASAKVTETNAYVTGFGASKRVVVWDNTVKNMPPDEISFIFAHEMGHYVLHHIVYGMAAAAALVFLCLWLGARTCTWLLRRFGSQWDIHTLHDPAALAVLLLILLCGQFLTEPLQNIVSRRIEHAADVYGQEAIHGIVPDPQATAARAFQLLGEQNLASPERRPFVDFWCSNHPSIADRIEFAVSYDPWSGNAHPKYFPK